MGAERQSWVVRLLLSRGVSLWLPASMRGTDTIEVMRARALLTCLMAFSVSMTALAAFIGVVVSPTRGVFLGGYAAAAVFGLSALRFVPAYSLIGHFCTGISLCYVLLAMYAYGGAPSSPMRWLVTVPLFGLLFNGARAGALWGAASLAGLGAFVALGDLVPDPQIPAATLERLHVGSFAIFLVCVYVLFVMLQAIHEWSSRAADLARERAEDADQRKSDFLHMTSHELRTPLNVIMGYAEYVGEVVEDATLDEEVPEELAREVSSSVGRLCAAGEHVLDLVDSILMASKLRSDGSLGVASEAEREFGADDVGRLALELVRSRDPSLLAARALDVHLESMGGAAVANAERIVEVAAALVSNALKFSGQGDPVHVRSHLAPGEGGGLWLEVEVRDFGVGIAPDHHELIFGGMWRVDTSVTRDADGMGLGLHIARAIALELGGGLEVESALGEGSVFRATFPVRAPEAVPPGDVPDSPSPTDAR